MKLRYNMIKVEGESQLFAQNVSGYLMISKEEELSTQRTQDNNHMMNIKKQFCRKSTGHISHPLLLLPFPRNPIFHVKLLHIEKIILILRSLHCVAFSNVLYKCSPTTA